MKYNAMKCLACNRSMKYLFRKSFPLLGLINVEYCKCPNCGFVASKTLAEMADHQWARLNGKFHATYQGTETDTNDPKWTVRLRRQANVIADLTSLGLMPRNRPWLDYGCGDGKLSSLMSKSHNLSLLKYEPCMNAPGYLPPEELMPGAFAFVISTSVFEHLRTRAQMECIADLIADDGVMGVHTLVAEQIPEDPSWFYFLPVHCSFFTNKSMQLIFNDWGYQASIYHVESQLWFWFKKGAHEVERVIITANQSSGREAFRYLFKRGFMDYWKLSSMAIMKRISGYA